MILRSAFFACAALLVSAALACGSSSNETEPVATNTGTTGSGGGTGQGGFGSGCDPACVAPQVCSSVGQCIDAGTCLADPDCGDGTICDVPSKTCVPGGMCGGQEATAESVPPNMLVVLDRSCSMQDKVGNLTKWDIAVAALDTLTTTYAQKIRFGLTLFPDTVTPSCQQDAIPIPVAPGNEAAMQALLAAALATNDPYYPDGPCVTNIDTAMAQAQTEPALADTTRDNFVLLITDGKQAGCNAAGGDAGTLQIITDLFAQDVGTFVVGFGSGIDAAQMNAFADAGGVPNADPNQRYYKADDQASLDAALQIIADKTLSCVFSLGDVPPDPSKIYVFFDNTTPVAQDKTHGKGWDYDPATNQITFYGADCDDLKTGVVKDVDIVFGCNEPTPD